MLRQKVRQLEQNGEIQRDYEAYTEPKLENGEAYDFIVVGAGSSGSALVYRLSEIFHWKILLLEAGGEPDILTDIPFWSPILHYTKQNWRYYSEKEDNIALGLKNQRIHYPRGKALGGSSTLNLMIFTRGVEEDYNRWANLGNPGWSYVDVFPVFQRLENCTLRYRDEIYRGYDGPISASKIYTGEYADVFLDAAMNAGYDCVDYNGRTNEGVSYLQTNIKDGFRCSGERCYLKPIKDRPNLTIRLNSHVSKILIDHKTAYGVEFYRNGHKYIAYANKEVILSAGAIASPQILMLSGIGPEDQLLKFGIKPVCYLPVGRKMLDHPSYLNIAYTFDKPLTFNGTAALDDKWFKQLYNKRTGLLANTGTGGNILFTRTSIAPNESTDIEIVYTGSSFASSGGLGLGGTFGVNDETYNFTMKPYEGQYMGACGVFLLHPRSHGRLELRSANPFDHPKIFTGFFTDPGNEDIKAMIAGIREAKRIMQTPPFDKYGTKEIDKPVYGCQHLKYDSDEYWECVLRHLGTSVFHPSTTCKMGPAEDPEAVVDHRLRVYGVANLRVVDTSIIPISLTAHLNIPAYMIGEKAADIIKEDHLFAYI
ncbi:hypothetical protein Trydic_g2505 [Trypoxylus dichotomus]